ncbi:MAG: hypothetical protein QM426_10920 [Euryarchaeota archaeon]|nr:hypothetical protein [Euryarchaeota archaeon]
MKIESISMKRKGQKFGNFENTFLSNPDVFQKNDSKRICEKLKDI